MTQKPKKKKQFFTSEITKLSSVAPHALVALSALLFGCAFLFSDCCAFTILFFLFPLFIFFKKTRSVLAYGFLWGLVAYSLHFIWVYDLLLHKSNASALIAFFLYFLVVLYSSCTSALWFKIIYLLKNFLQKKFSQNISGIASIFLGAIGYFIFLDRYMVWFFGTGYPFLNPFIPLVKYKTFFNLLFVLHSFFGFPLDVNLQMYHLPKDKKVVIKNRVGESYLFVYLEPCTKKSSFGCALQIYDRLKALELEKFSSRYKDVFVVGPETTFPFPFNKHKDFAGLWGQVMTENTHFMFGSTKREAFLGKGDKLYQVVYWLKKCLIMQDYVKTHRVIFTEKLPKILKKYKTVRSLFLENKSLISKGKNSFSEAVFRVSPNFSVKPILCSELFMCRTGDFLREDSKTSPLMVAFVNDNWFCSYFRKILLLSARLKMAYFGRNLVYIGHK